MPEQPLYVLSYGGGVNTVALLLALDAGDYPLDEVIFADTGGEVPETYDYLPRVQTFLDEREIPFRKLSHRIKDTDLYGTSWRRGVFPSAIWRWSTRDFKVKPIHRYYRKLDRPIVQYVGIAYDEIERMKDSGLPGVKNEYPLVDLKLTRAGCEELIASHDWPVPPKSGCYFCPFNGLERWRWLREEHPDLYANAVALEENSKHFPRQRLTDQVFRDRAAVTLRELGVMFDEGRAPTAADVVAADPCGPSCMT